MGLFTATKQSQVLPEKILLEELGNISLSQFKQLIRTMVQNTFLNFIKRLSLGAFPISLQIRIALNRMAELKDFIRLPSMNTLTIKKTC